MISLIKLAFRNVLRNKRRTFLAGIAIGIGLAALIFSDALIIGMAETMIKTATDTFLGHAQIHYKGFTDTFDVEKTIVDSSIVLKNLENDQDVRKYAPRTIANAMVTSPSNACSVLLFGIDPEKEKEISKIEEAMVNGEFLVQEDQEKILIGQDLAETLDVTIGDLIVMTVAQVGTGDLSQAMFRIGGIYKFNIQEMDSMMAFIQIKKSQEMLGLGKNVHEIAVAFDSLNLSEDKSLPFFKQFADSENQAKGWREIMPELDAAIKMSNFAIGIVGMILFGVVSLGIMNTLFMSLYERMFEFGVLRAIGTRPVRIGFMIVLEAGVLAVISIVIGIVLGLIITRFYIWHGIDYTGIEFAGVTFLEPLRPVLTIYQYYAYPCVLFIFTLLVGLYPAIYAALLNPVEAMRKSL